MKSKLTIFIPILFVILCSGAPIQNVNKKTEILGIWVYAEYDNGILNYTKANHFSKNLSGIEFKKNGRLLKRQNIGFCGTPPITYGNFHGHWEFTSDSTLTFKYNYWDGKAEEDWQIISLDATRFKIKRTAFGD